MLSPVAPGMQSDKNSQGLNKGGVVVDPVSKQAVSGVV